MTSLKFIKPYDGYNTNEIATFSDNQAEDIIRRGAAKKVSLVSPPKNAKSASQEYMDARTAIDPKAAKLEADRKAADAKIEAAKKEADAKAAKDKADADADAKAKADAEAKAKADADAKADAEKKAAEEKSALEQGEAAGEAIQKAFAALSAPETK